MVSHNTTVGFAGEEFKKSLDNLQSILDAAQPLIIKLVPYKQLKTSITEYVKTIQIFLCKGEKRVRNEQEKIEGKGKENLDVQQKAQERWEELNDKPKRTQEEEKELIEIEIFLGMRPDPNG